MNQDDVSVDIPVLEYLPKTLMSYDQWGVRIYDVGENDNGPYLNEHIEVIGSPGEALKVAMDEMVDMGFLLTHDDPFTVIELIDAIDKESGVIKPWAMSAVGKMKTYMETYGENNLRVVAVGSHDENKSRGNITLRCHDVFVPITGARIGNTRDTKHLDIEIDIFIDRYLSPTWMDEYRRITSGEGYSEYDALKLILESLLDDAEWYRDPEYRELYEFLSKCWEHKDLQQAIMSSIESLRWTRERREGFYGLIKNQMPKKEKKDAATQSLLSADDVNRLLQVDSKGRPKETFFNMSMILQRHDEWTGRLSFDEFRNTMLLDNVVVTDTTEHRIAEWMGKTYGFGGNHARVITRAIHAASTTQTFDSLQTWISKLPVWDGNSRIHSWMVECCGAEDTPLTHWISYVTIMQMVARAKTPGCMARFVPVFEGPENRGKTRCIKLLGDPWSMTFDMSMDNKEAHMAMAGCWVAELAELDTLRKTTETRLKSFISQQDDTYLPKYSNNRVSHPRRTVFFGTTNESNYLPSEQGNTRWLPIGTEWFDLERIESEREQLFAEAIAMFEAIPDIKWWEEPEEIKDTITEARDDRRIINVYEDPLMRWLDGRSESGGPRDHVTWSEIADEFLGLDKKEWKDKSLQWQITQALKAHGWKPRRTYIESVDMSSIDGRRGKVQKRVWVRPDTGTIMDDVPF